MTAKIVCCLSLLLFPGMGSLLHAELTHQAYLKSTATRSGDWFSRSVAISGDTAVVGAWYDAFSGYNSGAAYVYVRINGEWAFQQVLQPSNASFCANFGGAVAVSGDTIVVGARLERSGSTGVNGNQQNGDANQSGAAYVFNRSAGVWTQEAYLKASNTGASDNFGGTVAVSGNTILVGAIGEDSRATGVNGLESDDLASASGAVYVFRKTTGSWTQEAYLKASNSASNELFGWSLAIEGNTVVIGASQERGDINSNGQPVPKGNVASGAAYVFDRQGSAWSQTAYLKSPQPVSGGYFGSGVGVSGDTLVIGEGSGTVTKDSRRLTGAGLAHIYKKSAGLWIRDSSIWASNAESDHGFGEKVGIDGGRIIVGAPRESGDASGANGDPGNQRSIASGAAYFFERNPSGVWIETDYLKASNCGAGDQFGRDVAISGDGMIVASWYEDSSAQGVNGGQSSDTSTDSGSAYIFGSTAVVPGARIAVRQGERGTLSSGAVVSMGVTTVNAPKDFDFWIENAGTFAIEGLSITINFDNSNWFSIPVSPGTTVQPGESHPCKVRFLPTGSGSRYVELKISATNATDFKLGLRANYLTQIEIWRQSKFGFPGNLAEAHDDADPDHDGVENLFEYASNLEPLIADNQTLDSISDRRGLPWIRKVDTPYPHLRVDYIRRKSTTNPGIYYVPQHSTNLVGDWSNFQGILNVTSLDSTWQRVSVDFAIIGPNQFARMHLIRQ